MHGLLTLLSGAAPPSIPLIQSGLQLLYPLNESSGPALSGIAGSSSLTDSNGPVGVAGLGGTVRQFQRASSQSLFAADAAPFHLPNGPFTLIVWTDLSTIAAAQTLLWKGDGSGVEYELTIGGQTSPWTFTKFNSFGEPLAVAASSFVSAVNPTGISTGQEDMIAVRCDGKNLYISVNAGSEDPTPWQPNYYVSTGNIIVGGVAGNYFDGLASRLQLWTYDLGSATIAGLYHAGAPVDYPYTSLTPGLVAPIVTLRQTAYSPTRGFTMQPGVTQLSSAWGNQYLITYFDGAGDETAPNDIKAALSTDGLTFSSPVVIQTDATHELQCDSPPFEILTAPPTAGGGAPHDILQWVRKILTVSPETVEERQFRSTNGGTVWVDEGTLPTFGFASGLVAGYGRAHQLASGRIIRPCYSPDSSAVNAPSASAVIYSDDGKNWAKLGTIAYDGVKAWTETAIINTGGSNWLAVFRNDQTALTAGGMAQSTDDGATWGAVTALPFNCASPTLVRGVDNNIYLFVFQDSYRISTDNGATWGQANNINNSKRGYASAINVGGDLRYYGTNAVNQSGQLTVFTLLAAPAPTATTNGTTNTISWLSVPNATSYTVKRGTASGGPYGTTVFTGAATACTDSTVSAGTAYYYTVSATNAQGAVATSSQVFILTTALNDPLSLIPSISAWWNGDGAAGAGETERKSGILNLSAVNAPGAGAGVGGVGNARKFSSAAHQYLTVPDAAGLRAQSRDVAFVCWFRLTSAGTNVLFSKYNGSANEYECVYVASSNIIEFVAVTSGGNKIANIPFVPVLGQWYFLVGWFDDTAQTVNVEINRSAPVSTSFAGTTINGGTSPFQLGANTPIIAGDEWDGGIQAFAVFNTAAAGGAVLTATQKDWLYNNGVPRKMVGGAFV